MNVRAETEFKFWLRFLIIGLLALGYGLWGSYDALVEGPKRVAQAKIWEPLQLNESLEESERDALWAKAATENGWNTKRPKADITTKDAKEFVIYNYGVMVVCGLVALPCLFWCLRSRGTWIESTEKGLRNSSGQELSLEQITKIDKGKWDKKGIAVVHYSDPNGTDQKFIIDDLKYQRAHTDQIMAWVEDNIDPGLIVNGRTEAQVVADKEAAAAKRRQEQQDQDDAQG